MVACLFTGCALTDAAWHDTKSLVADASAEYHDFEQFTYEPWCVVAPVTGHVLSPVYFLGSFTFRGIAGDTAYEGAPAAEEPEAALPDPEEALTAPESAAPDAEEAAPEADDTL
jgi:hypothetical protein